MLSGSLQFVTVKKMPWSSSCEEDDGDEDHDRRFKNPSMPLAAMICPSCGQKIQVHNQQASSGIQNFPELPAGVKFDPTDQELLEHLEGKVRPDLQKLHPLIDKFIPTIEGDNGICYTHPEKLPGVTKDGLIRHFFHRPSKAYTTGNRKRRKVNTNEQGGETRWHKTGKTRPIYANNKVKGHKKILVLYTNYGKLKKPEKTNWVMHQYHLGSDEEEKDGELVVSKIFYQTQPRQCNSTTLKDDFKDEKVIDCYNSSLISYDNREHHRAEGSSHLMHNFGSPFLH
ncbi:hypothetical protein KFK09_026883 [Dendrobium nobile]|uniref:NAC domain-containing protein n=1 Tax=Dendrobium nobile TaxID=94219 RepID=A0A8T3A841_DENNO|nr:hypothetical protein KFK09_026883 [Dendrobium nobile]